MADANPTTPAPLPPGTGPGPIGVLGGTDRSYSVDIMVCAASTAAIGLVFVALRFYTRWFIMQVLNWEDWLLLASQIFSVVMCAGFIQQAALGHGSHVLSIPLENFPRMGRIAWYTIFFYELSLACSQVSILLLYIRIWRYPGVRHAAYWLLAIVMVYNIFVVATVATACIPLAAFWDFELRGQAYCHPMAVWWANTAMHIITDFMIYLLPMPVIFRVQFPMRQKILLFVLFAFGFFVCAISIIRLYLLKITLGSLDFTFDNVSIAFWTCFETNGTVAIASFMTMKPLLSRFLPGLVEVNRERVVIGSIGRVPTVGARRMRPLPGVGPRSTTLASIRYEAIATDEHGKIS